MQWGKSLYINLLVVIPEFQRKGIGTDMLNRLKQDARADQRFMYMNISSKKQ